jgi:hypothetical protein
MVCPLGTENDIKRSIDAPDEFTDVSQWHFIYDT